MKLISTIIVAALAMVPLMTHAQKVYGPTDISYLANTFESNKGYYNANIMGATEFSGQGVVFQNRPPRVSGSDGSYEDGEINVDVGTGWVSCQMGPGNSAKGIRRGDVVRISGMTGGAMTWRSLKADNETIGPAPGVQWRAGYEYAKKDEVSLLTDTCHVEKVQ